MRFAHLLCVLVLAGCGSKDKGGASADAGGPKPAPDPSEWTSDPALEAKLAPERRMFKRDGRARRDFNLRLPAAPGVPPHPDVMPGSSTTWQSTPRADKTEAKFEVNLWRLTGDDANLPPDFPLTKVLIGANMLADPPVVGAEGPPKLAPHTPLEEGRIRGQAFMRVTYHVDIPAARTPSGKPETMHGVAYHARDGGWGVVISFADTAPHHADTFPVFEAAARTFRFADE